MKLYKIKLIKEDVSMPIKKKAEVTLRDLLTIMPTLKKHKLEGEILTKVRKLRSGRSAKHYTLELSRNFPTYDPGQGKIIKELRVSAPLTKAVKKIDVLKDLKAQIIQQIQDLRRNQLPVIDNYRFREGIEVKKLAEVYLEAGAFAKVAHKRVRLNMTKAKVPKTADKYIGIELEFAAKENRDVLCDKLFEAGVGKYVCVKNDSSIKVDDDYQYSHEVCILVKENEYRDIISKICKVLNTEMNVRVDKSCGLHVHLDMRHRNPAHSYANLITMQHFLYAMGPAARKTGRYSIPIKDKAWRVSDNHYDGVSSNSYAKYKTIELRMHAGTTQASKVNGFIKFLLAIADAPAIDKAPTSTKDIKALINIDDELLNYVESRIAKFASQHKKIEKDSSPLAWMDKVEAVATLPDSVSQEEQSEVA